MTKDKDHSTIAGPSLPIGNLFEHMIPPNTGEGFTTLLAHRNLVVERIISSDAITPTEYVQTQDEWVVLLQGEAELLVAGRHYTLKSGDYIFLPALTPHTLLHTSVGALWLGVHLHAEATPGETDSCNA